MRTFLRSLIASLLVLSATSPALAKGASAGAPPAAPPAAEKTRDTGAVPNAQKPGESADSTSSEASASDEALELRKKASERFQRGVAFYEDGDHVLALIEFDRAYQLIPDYRVLYNIGQVSIQLSKFARARHALELYLEKGRAELPPERIEEVEGDLRMLGARTAYLEFSLTPEGAELLIDDVSQGQAPLSAALLLDAGEHRVVVRKEGYSTYSERIELAGAERIELEVKLEPKQADAPVVIVREPEDPGRSVRDPDQVESGLSPATLGWTATGAFAVGAAVTGALGFAAKGDLRDLQRKPDPSREQLEASASRASNYFLAADILAVAAVASCGVSLYLALENEDSEAPPKALRSVRNSSGIRNVHLQVGPGSVRLGGAF